MINSSSNVNGDGCAEVFVSVWLVGVIMNHACKNRNDHLLVLALVHLAMTCLIQSGSRCFFLPRLTLIRPVLFQSKHRPSQPGPGLSLFLFFFLCPLLFCFLFPLKQAKPR